MRLSLLLLFGLLFYIASSNIVNAQYSISGYLDAPEKNKKVYLSLLEYDEQRAMSSEQILTSTITDSLGFFSFEGQLLSDKHALYRIHAKVDKAKSTTQFVEVDDLKNFHNFIFSNRDTIVFKSNNKFWFSNNTNTNPIDKEWQKFNSYVYQLRRELSSLSDLELKTQSSAQILSELKSYANTKDVHPLVTLLLLSGVEKTILKEDFKNDYRFYMKLQDRLNSYYDYSGYAAQFKELTTELSTTETQLKLDYYKKLTYILGIICVGLVIGIILVVLRLKQHKQRDIQQENINFTNQEERVAELIMQEKTNKEIAAELFISLSTVKTHVRNLYAKLEVNNRQHFVDKLKNHPRD